MVDAVADQLGLSRSGTLRMLIVRAAAALNIPDSKLGDRSSREEDQAASDER